MRQTLIILKPLKEVCEGPFSLERRFEPKCPNYGGLFELRAHHKGGCSNVSLQGPGCWTISQGKGREAMCFLPFNTAFYMSIESYNIVPFSEKEINLLYTIWSKTPNCTVKAKLQGSPTSCLHVFQTSASVHWYFYFIL